MLIEGPSNKQRIFDGFDYKLILRMKILQVEPTPVAWMRLHNAWRYSGLPQDVIEEGIACGAIRAFRLHSQYHRKLKGRLRPQIILVNVESLDRFIETKEKEAVKRPLETLEVAST